MIQEKINFIGCKSIYLYVQKIAKNVIYPIHNKKNRKGFKNTL